MNGMWENLLAARTKHREELELARETQEKIDGMRLDFAKKANVSSLLYSLLYSAHSGYSHFTSSHFLEISSTNVSSLLYSAHSGYSHFTSSHFLAVFSTFGIFSFYLLPFYLLPLVPCCIQHIRDILILPPPISLLYSAHSGYSHFTSSHFLAVFSTFGIFSFYLLPFYLLPLVPCCIQHIRDILILPPPISLLYSAHSGYSHFTSSYFLAVFSTFGIFSFCLLPFS